MPCFLRAKLKFNVASRSLSNSFATILPFIPALLEILKASSTNSIKLVSSEVSNFFARCLNFSKVSKSLSFFSSSCRHRQKL
jgi:hypothetical protein